MDRIAHFRGYLEAHPGDRFALYSLALELKKAGRIDEAQQAFDWLLAEHPTSGAGHYQHGLMWLDEGDEDAARAAWKAGLRALHGVNDPEARRSRSEIEGALADLD